MRINRVRIENFRNHKETTLDLDRINFFAGHNNAGKSSILAALEWGLTGRCLWTDKAGRGATELIRQGEKNATVAMEIEGLGTVIRSLPPHTLHVGQISGVNEGQSRIQNHLHVDESRLQVALNANAFLAMSQAEQRSFLFSAYGLSWTVEEVVEELIRWLVKERINESEARRLAAKAKKYYPAGITGGPEIFEAMEKRAREERKDLKKGKQQAEAALAEIVMGGRDQGLPIDLEDSKSQLTELKIRRDELLKACGAHRETQLRQQTLLEKIRHTSEKFAKAQDMTQSLAIELESLSGPVDADAETSEVEITLQKTFDTANATSAAIRSKLESINKAGRSLTYGKRRCPLAPDLLQCSLTQDQLDAVLSSLRKEHNVASQELEDLEATIQDSTEKLITVRTSLEKSRARSKRVLFLQSDLNSQKYLTEALGTSLSDLKSELESLPAEDQGLLEDLAQLECTISQIESALAQYNGVQVLISRQRP